MNQQNTRSAIELEELLLGRVRVLQWILGGICAGIFAIFLAAIPWAFMVQSDIARIQVKIEQISTLATVPERLREDIAEHRAKIRELEKRVTELEKNGS